MPSLHVDEAIELIQMEYIEMPGLTLTFWQAQRLWNLSDELCERALTSLTTSGFLDRTPDGAYVRRVASPAIEAPDRLSRAMQSRAATSDATATVSVRR